VICFDVGSYAVETSDELVDGVVVIGGSSTVELARDT
jgi:hypothetical protein